MIPNSRFLTGVGRSTRDHSVLFWDDGASWATGQGPGSYCAGWLAGWPGGSSSQVLSISRQSGWSGSGYRFPDDWDTGWPRPRPDSPGQQRSPGTQTGPWTGLDWTELGWTGLDTPVSKHMTSNGVVMEEPQRRCCDYSCSTAVPEMHNNAA